MANVSTVMTANPASCAAQTPLPQVAQMMADNDCGQIPVVDADNRPIGVVTDRDIAVRVVASGRDASAATAADAMSTPCKSVSADTSLQECTRLMETEKVRRIPVTDQDGRLAGIVSIADIALAGKDKATVEVVREVSEPGQR